VPNRRKRVRHKVHTPAYACFRTQLQSATLDLHEIVDISEDGIAIQCHSPLERERQIHLCLDLAECPEQIYTTARVIWSDDSGRSGLSFSELSSESLSQLREWLLVHTTSGALNGEADLTPAPLPHSQPATPPNYTDMLAAVTAVQRQVEAIGPDLARSLQFIAERSQALVRGSGAAIALAGEDPDFMICRASAGPDAPPAGVRLQVGSGFSGECVKSGTLLRCDDSDLDSRVDRESCRALGIRSILAAPVRAGERSVGLIEVFAQSPNAFSDGDAQVLQRLAESVLGAANRAARAENSLPLGAAAAAPFASPQGSVLFASGEENEPEAHAQEKNGMSISLPRSHLIILICSFATVALAMGYRLAPWIQVEVVPWVQFKLHSNGRSPLPTVLASSQPPKVENASSTSSGPAIETATLDQLKQMADKGDPAAANTVGLRYATGEGVPLDEGEAVRWFTKAAEAGYVPAQSKLGSIYFSGRGVPQDSNRAYFWMVVARLSGDDASKTLAPFVRARLTRAQITSIELEADRWLQQHQTNSKPAAGQLRARS
jgi:TPR repeat protein